MLTFKIHFNSFLLRIPKQFQCCNLNEISKKYCALLAAEKATLAWNILSSSSFILTTSHNIVRFIYVLLLPARGLRRYETRYLVLNACTVCFICLHNSCSFKVWMTFVGSLHKLRKMKSLTEEPSLLPTLSWPYSVFPWDYVEPHKYSLRSFVNNLCCFSSSS